ncbi:MAG: CBU_0592 family membrane protein [Gammaproteobacteria bacterium]
MTAASAANVVGLGGAAAVLAAYLLLLTGKLRRSQRSFLLLNAFGSAGILCSLAFRFNLSATLIEAAWFAISIYGFARRTSRTNRLQ